MVDCVYVSEMTVNEIRGRISVFLKDSKEKAENGDDLNDTKSKGIKLIEEYVEALKSYSDDIKEEANICWMDL